MSEWKKLGGQLLRFLLVGGLAVAIDGSIYFALTQAVQADPVWAKRVSYVTGALWGFFANKYFTFRQSGFDIREPLLFVLVYVFGWFCNSLVHDVTLSGLHRPWLSFLAATGVSTCTNFVGQKWLVFRGRKQPAPS